MSSVVLPARFYNDPEQAFSHAEARELYQKKGCTVCASFDMSRRGVPCKKNLTPAKHWCRGFDEE